MKNLTFFLSLTLCSSALFLFNFQLPNQAGPELPAFSEASFEAKSSPGWYKVKEGVKLTKDQLTQNVKNSIGFSDYDDLVLLQSKTDKLGITNSRYEQYHRGVKVYASRLIINEQEGRVSNFNGHWVENMNKIVSPKLSANQAIQKALQYIPAEVYLWESENAQRSLQKSNKNPQATYYPKADLVWFDSEFSRAAENYRLAYEMEINAQFPFLVEQVWIDALTGELLYNINNIQHANSNGKAVTKYSGVRDIVTDSIGVNSFRLRETNRNGHGVNITVLDIQNQIDLVPIDFIDDDNYWDNVNANIDEAATDAHWGSEMVHDYLLEKHDYLGVDGNGFEFTCHVNLSYSDQYGDPIGFPGAYWAGGHAVFGVGNSSFWPFTELDIVGHEFAHGITEFAGGLLYRGESGAINESFSDLLGTSVEFWATPEQADWTIGEDCDKSGVGYRSMSNPNEHDDPDTYEGDFWLDPNCGTPTNLNDACGVHTNSGVHNYWYHLLVEGGSGVNDKGLAFDVPGLGHDTAIAIVWRNLHNYLTPTSIYEDAMLGSLQATADLYGPCSPAFTTVLDAWYAVGLGDGSFENNIELTAILDYEPVNCGLSEEEFPKIKITYKSCFPELVIGTKIPVAAQVDGGAIIRDTLTLDNDLAFLETTEFTFTRPVSGLETGGMHTLVTWTEFPADDLSYNDTISFTLENVIEQNSDFTTTNVPPLIDDCFLGTQNVGMVVLFLGCDMIPAGTSMDMYYRANGGTPISETTTLPTDLSRGQTFRYNFNTPLDLTGQLGINKIDFWVDLANDFLNENDTLLAQIAYNPYLMVDKNLVTFEAEESSLDSVYFTTTFNSSAILANYFRFEEPNILQMGGGDFESLLASNQAIVPGASSVWQDKNASIAAQACFCIDASDMVNVRFSFDLQQSYTRNWQALYGSENQYGSACRVVAEGTQVGDSYFPETLNSDPVTNRVFDLDDYAGSIFEVCIESRCGFSPEADAFNKGDFVRVDNVMIEGVPLGLNDLPQLSGIKVFPNPSAGSVNVTFESKEAKDLQLEVYDIYGRVITTLQRQTLSANQSHQFNLDQLAPGTYYFHFSNERGKKIEKVVLF